MALKVGDKIPVFKLQNQKGEEIDISSYLGNKILVIYFYPKDDTPGCTKEACSFSDKYDVFKEAGAEVFGISSDSVSSHQKFGSKFNVKFNLLSDAKGKIRKKFGVPNSFLFVPGRVTYIIDLKGEIVYLYNSLLKAENHIEEALKKINELKRD